MYQVKFVNWGLRKNLNQEKREEYFKKKEAGLSSSDTEIDRKLQRSDRKRFKEIENKRRAMRETYTLHGGDPQNSEPEHHAASGCPSNRSDVDDSYISNEFDCGGAEDLTQHTFSQNTAGNELMWPFSHCSFPFEENGVSFLDFPATTDLLPQQQEALAMACSPSPPLPVGAEDLNTELVLHCVEHFTEKVLSDANSAGLEDWTEPPLTSTLWSSISQCIYLYKVGHLERAKPLLDQLCSNDMEAALYPSMKSLRNLITAFSPINFRRYPRVRRQLLGHLVDSASATRQQTDSLLVISKQLLRDCDTRATTEVALSCLIDTAQTKSKSPSLVHGARRAVIALLRRDKQLGHALDKAIKLVEITSGSAPESLEARTALKEKAHILMDRKEEGDLDEALRLSRLQVGLCVRDNQATTYRDQSAMHTMEDIAKIHDELNELQKSVVWLESAANLGRDLGVDRMAITHVVDKLVDAQRKLQYNSELNYKRIFEPFMWVP
ncbi:MAG: hypothetical protein Q9181_005930 [Wetmoreana brouardii]